MSAVVLDTETTDVSDDAKVIEFACSSLIDSPVNVCIMADQVTVAEERFSSDRPISMGAMAVHHIIDEDLVGLRPFPGLDTARGIDYIVGHNIDYDWRMMGRPKVRRICTFNLARSLWPLIESHALGALVYHLSRDKQQARRMLRGAHSAKTDVECVLDVVLPEILLKLHPRAKTWEELWIISEDARIPTVMSFGKHKGMPLGDVPQSYKRWLLDQPDVDPYLAIALRK
jgi:exodeoxyribonuclease X